MFQVYFYSEDALSINVKHVAFFQKSEMNKMKKTSRPENKLYNGLKYWQKNKEMIDSSDSENDLNLFFR